MTDGDALVRSILAAPADDAPRLVYADWLDEQGRAEDAEFIRVQVELARLGFDGGLHTDEQGRLRHPPPNVADMISRQLELWNDGYGRPDLPAGMLDWPVYPVNTRATRVRVRRGFVERLSCKCDEFTAVAGDLFARQPVTDVRVVDLEPVRPGRNDAYSWYCALPGTLEGPPYWVPTPVWAFLVKGGTAKYETADEAEMALSWACVQYGRSLIGLTSAESPGQHNLDR